MRLTHEFRVGIRGCKILLDTNTGFMKVKWEPGPPRNMTDQELEQYREGRDALLAKAGEMLGGSVLVVET